MTKNQGIIVLQITEEQQSELFKDLENILKRKESASKKPEIEG